MKLLKAVFALLALSFFTLTSQAMAQDKGLIGIAMPNKTSDALDP